MKTNHYYHMIGIEHIQNVLENNNHPLILIFIQLGMMLIYLPLKYKARILMLAKNGRLQTMDIVVYIKKL